MKRLITIFLILTFVLPAFTQTTQPYQPNWESLDSRPTPQWWQDAKLGIFIHWGIYSVPSFTRSTDYAEWYWNQLKSGHTEVTQFHNRVYGENFSYADFATLFKTELFNAGKWAELFKNAGAKYVVLTSKHHDGFALWPSKEANEAYARHWNSTSSGPQRDLLGELTNAVRDAGLKMGIYYSLYEWYNPLWLNDRELYVKEHMIPQFKDVVNNYQPSIIFSDGEWDMPDKNWKSEEILAWLYNESPSKEDVIVNDRWGKGVRHHHGGYYTTEYGSGMSDGSVPWEESRGIGHSYGYNRNEDLSSYSSSQELILMLIDIVSRGGNFLLNVGPTADGRIPVIMQQRLMDMGQWLSVNGEAIYGTRPWENVCQWSAGTIDEAKRGEYKTAYDVLKLTVDPDPGKAVKEVLFTTKGKTLYAICPVYPNQKLVLRDVQATAGTKVELLGTDKNLKWRNRGKDLIIEVPPLESLPRISGSAAFSRNYAFTFKIAQLVPHFNQEVMH